MCGSVGDVDEAALQGRNSTPEQPEQNARSVFGREGLFNAKLPRPAAHAVKAIIRPRLVPTQYATCTGTPR